MKKIIIAYVLLSLAFLLGVVTAYFGIRAAHQKAASVLNGHSALTSVKGPKIATVSGTREDLLEMAENSKYWRIVTDGSEFRAQCRLHLTDSEWFDLGESVSTRLEASRLIAKIQNTLRQYCEEPGDAKWRPVPGGPEGGRL